MPEKDPSPGKLPVMDWVESAKKICELWLKKIADVKLGKESPHLYQILVSGEVLFISGQHDKFESGQVEVHNYTNEDEVFIVSAGPGDDIAVWVPEDILEQEMNH